MTSTRCLRSDIDLQLLHDKRGSSPQLLSAAVQTMCLFCVFQHAPLNVKQQYNAGSRDVKAFCGQNLVWSTLQNFLLYKSNQSSAIWIVQDFVQNAGCNVLIGKSRFCMATKLFLSRSGRCRMCTDFFPSYTDYCKPKGTITEYLG